MKRPKIDGEKIRNNAMRGVILAAVGAFLVGSVGIYLLTVFSSKNSDDTTTNPTAQTKEKPVDQSLIVKEPITELQKIDEVVGNGDEVKAGATVKVNYKGALATTGQIFDQSTSPIELGLDQVIQGWKDGIPGMKVGGKRKLLIPAAQGYGASGTPDGSIPPNSDLVFEVEVVSISK
ncbi:MAG TPA: FKBP-type peptidyl-prolyl cis-trans isomerase [Candidatus Saccharimonadales bacterium]|nr:FKBP-type peptidyl-prolyl cis-trans isomerase [Candidatus Saccharimonadales bacterium]